jgi:hypothetical protein
MKKVTDSSTSERRMMRVFLSSQLLTVMAIVQSLLQARSG